MLTFRAVTTRIAASGRLGLQGLRRAPDTDQILAVLAFVALLVDPLLLHEISQLTPVMGVLAFVTAAPLVARRRFPLGVLAVALPLLLACLVVFHPNRAAVGIIMLLVFTVGLEGGRSRSLVVGALMALVVTAAVFITGTQSQPGRRHRLLFAGARRSGGRRGTSRPPGARPLARRRSGTRAARPRPSTASTRSASRWPTSCTTSSGTRWSLSTSRPRPLRAASARPAAPRRPRRWRR